MISFKTIPFQTITSPINPNLHFPKKEMKSFEFTFRNMLDQISP